MSRSGLFFVLVSASLWATVGVATGMVPDASRWPAEVLALSRTGLAGPLLLAVGVATQGMGIRTVRALPLRDLALLGVSCAVFQICLFRSFTLVGVTAAVFVNVGLRPVIAMGWSRLVRKEPLRSVDLAALALASLGLGLLCAQGFTDGAGKAWWIGIPVCALGATAFVAMSCATGNLARSSTPLVASGAGLTLASVLLLGCVLVASTGGAIALDSVRFDTSALLLVAYLALLPTAAAFFCFSLGMARCRSAVVASIAVMVQPPITAILAAWLLGEALTPVQAAGCAALLGAMVVLWFEGRPVPRRAKVLRLQTNGSAQP